MKLSTHSKIRMRQRTGLNHKERRKLFRSALDYGQSPANIKNNKVKQFMLARSNKCKIKLYKGYIFIYSKNSHTLYTMYKLPQNLMEEEI